MISDPPWLKWIVRFNWAAWGIGVFYVQDPILIVLSVLFIGVYQIAKRAA